MALTSETLKKFVNDISYLTLGLELGTRLASLLR